MPRLRDTAPIGPLVALGLAAAAAVSIFTSGGPDQRHVFVVVPDAANVIAGQEVRAGGQPVGEIEAVTAIRGGRAARIEIGIDKQAWPLTRRTVMQVRWGGTIAYDNRYIELQRGPGDAPPIPDGGQLLTDNLQAPVEFDQLLNTFTPKLRLGLKAMLDNAGAAFRSARGPLRSVLLTAPAALVQTGSVLTDLQAESASLDTLVRSGDNVVNAIDQADPGVGRLVSGAATTLGAAASQARALGATLGELPSTFAQVRMTLARAEHTLSAAGDLSDRLAPGVAQLRTTATPLTSVLASLVAVSPDLRSMLGTALGSASSVTAMLRRATDLMPTVGSISRQSADQLRCIRPYAPDIAAFFSTWGDWTSNSDGRGTYTRIAPLAAPFSNAETSDSAQLAQLNPGLSYAFPRPPGLAANQPWLLPACGVGRDALDPTKDPEARGFQVPLRAQHSGARGR